MNIQELLLKSFASEPCDTELAEVVKMDYFKLKGHLLLLPQTAEWMGFDNCLANFPRALSQTGSLRKIRDKTRGIVRNCSDLTCTKKYALTEEPKQGVFWGGGGWGGGLILATRSAPQSFSACYGPEWSSCFLQLILTTEGNKQWTILSCCYIYRIARKKWIIVNKEDREYSQSFM